MKSHPQRQCSLSPLLSNLFHCRVELIVASFVAVLHAVRKQALDPLPENVAAKATMDPLDRLTRFEMIFVDY